LAYLTPAEQEEVDNILRAELPAWTPLPGPQTAAHDSLADILYYGGSAGGGKTDLLIGLAITQHKRSIIYRRESTQLQAIYDRAAEILGNRNGFNGQSNIWRLPDRQIDFGSAQYVGDEVKYQGRPHDLIGLDEICLFAESQFRFLMGWLRTTTQSQRCRVVCTGNPPTTDDGRWVISFWGPWLDDKHPNPAKPGELRWFTTIDGKDLEVEDGKEFYHENELIIPKSRTFIPSTVSDNPFLIRTGYTSQLQALPEPLRSQLLYGDFKAGMTDSEWQVIPTAWVDMAQDRWKEDGFRYGAMDSMGVDVARGGQDKTVIYCRHGRWFSKDHSFPGKETPDGGATAGLVVSVRRDDSPVHVDVIGVGGSVVDHLTSNEVHNVPVNGAGKAGDG
jgi:hypothetical protein